MKTSNKILLGLFAFLLFLILTGMITVKNSFVPAGFGKGDTSIIGNNTIKKINPTISNFNALDISGVFKTTLVPGKPFLEMEGEANIVDLLSIQVYPNGQLEIKAKKEYELHPTQFIQLKIGIDTLKHIHIMESVLLSATAPLNVEKLELIAYQNCEIDLDLSAEKLDLRLQNASSANLTGETKSLSIYTQNSASVSATNLSTEKAYIKSYNSSKVNVSAKSELNIEAYNNSRVHYKGAPDNLKERAHNAAKIRQN